MAKRHSDVKRCSASDATQACQNVASDLGVITCIDFPVTNGLNIGLRDAVAFPFR